MYKLTPAIANNVFYTISAFPQTITLPINNSLATATQAATALASHPCDHLTPPFASARHALGTSWAAFSSSGPNPSPSEHPRTIRALSLGLFFPLPSLPHRKLGGRRLASTAEVVGVCTHSTWVKQTELRTADMTTLNPRFTLSTVWAQSHLAKPPFLHLLKDLSSSRDFWGAWEIPGERTSRKQSHNKC